MTIKNVFAPLTSATASGSSLETALLLAKTYRAHAEVLFIKESTQFALRAAAFDEARFAAQDLAERLEGEQEKAEKLARQKFDDLLAQYRID